MTYVPSPFAMTSAIVGLDEGRELFLDEELSLHVQEFWDAIDIVDIQDYFDMGLTADDLVIVARAEARSLKKFADEQVARVETLARESLGLSQSEWQEFMADSSQDPSVKNEQASQTNSDSDFPKSKEELIRCVANWHFHAHVGGVHADMWGRSVDDDTRKRQDYARGRLALINARLDGKAAARASTQGEAMLAREAELSPNEWQIYRSGSSKQRQALITKMQAERWPARFNQLRPTALGTVDQVAHEPLRVEA